MAFDTFNQLIRDTIAFNAHDAFLGAVAIAQKIDAAIPDCFLIHDSEFLVNRRVSLSIHHHGL